MKFFTPQLWLAFNKSSRSPKADKQWEKNTKAYNSQLAKLRPRLTKSGWHFFSKVSLHDGTLLQFSTGDHLFESLKSLRSRTWYWIVNKRQPVVQMHVLHQDCRSIYQLKYRGIRKVVLDHPGHMPLFVRYKDHPIDDWGYHELTSANKNYLKHEILFSSGATILIEFHKFSYKRLLLSSKRLPK